MSNKENNKENNKKIIAKKEIQISKEDVEEIKDDYFAMFNLLFGGGKDE